MLHKALTVDTAHTFFVGDSQWLVHNCPVNDDVIVETRSASGNITSKYTVSEEDVIDTGTAWVGPDRIVDADRGVYRSTTPNTDGTYNQFRIDPDSFEGNHDPHVPHFHLEIIEITPRTERRIVNNHIPIAP